MDTMADWEVGHITTELNSKRFFKKDAPEVSFKTVGISKEAVKSMGGLTIVPDCVIDENSVLLLPGSDVWSEPELNCCIVVNTTSIFIFFKFLNLIFDDIYLSDNIII